MLVNNLHAFNPSTLQAFNPSTLQLFNPSTLQPFHPSILPFVKPSTLQSFNPSSLQPRTAVHYMCDVMLANSMEVSTESLVIEKHRAGLFYIYPSIDEFRAAGFQCTLGIQKSKNVRICHNWRTGQLLTWLKNNNNCMRAHMHDICWLPGFSCQSASFGSCTLAIPFLLHLSVFYGA